MNIMNSEYLKTSYVKITQGIFVIFRKTGLKSRDMLYDEVLGLVGPFGKYQKTLLLVAGLILSAEFGITNLVYVFISALPDHWCHVPELHSLNLTTEQIKEVSLPVENGKYR